MRVREGRKIRTLVVTGERGGVLGMLIQVRVMPRWADDPVRR